MRIALSGDGWVFKTERDDDWRAARVPGSVLDDLLRSGAVPNPYFEDNSRRVEWVSQSTWVYKREFSVPAAHQGKRIRLHFEGVDYEASFELNGRALGRHTSMFVPVSFDVTDMVRYGHANDLSVVLYPAPDEQGQVGYTSRVRTHKTRMTYGWDFCPRMVHVGIWDDAWLEVTGPSAIDNVWVRARLAQDLSRAELDVTATLSGAAAAIETTITRADRAIAAQRSTSRVQLFELNQPDLWWPNGAGDQPLYAAHTRVLDANGEISDERITNFGIRRIEFSLNAGAEPSARPYTLRVNGRRLYINGWNWVPIDAMYGPDRPAKLVRLLRLAKRAHVNLLRVWGGGLIEKKAFYDQCDRHGLLVWQEFIQSSSGLDNAPSSHPEFVAMLVREAESIVPRRRNHPSLAIWCGGNELQSDSGPLDDSTPALGALHRVIERLDPDRYWLPTSPSGPIFGNTLENIERHPHDLHDVHGPWEHQGLTAQCTLYNRGVSLLHTEFGVEGLTNRAALETTLSAEHRWPATKTNPHYRHRGDWWINEPRLQEMWGSRLGDLETLRRASQYAQADGLRYAVESNRRRMWRNSGSLPWQFNESFPNAYCTSAVDYYGQPKAAYYAVARAYARLAVSARFETLAWAGRPMFEAELWACSALPSATEGELTARIVGASGRVYLERRLRAAIQPDAATRLGKLACPTAEVGEDLFFLDISLDAVDCRYLFSRTDTLAPMLALPRVPIDVELQAQGDRCHLTLGNAARSAALLLTLETEADAYFSDNHLTLLPGERRQLEVEWDGVAPDGRRLKIQGWNTERYVVQPDWPPSSAKRASSTAQIA